ncbi:L,D-transpeptidase family protein [Sphingomonas pokkalii]|nr:L,D-transpeptidase family protein [Sphingomonas pokkalii]
MKTARPIGLWISLAAIAVAVAVSAGMALFRQKPAVAVATLPLPPKTARIRLIGQEDVFSRADGTAQPVKSLLRLEAPMRYGSFVWNERGVPAGETWLRIDLSKQILSVFRGGEEIGTSVILYGQDDKPTPTGDFPVLWMGKNHRSSLYDAEMPYTLRLTRDGVAIHGSDVREGLATHGCIGVPMGFAAHLFDVVKPGTIVTVLR